MNLQLTPFIFVFMMLIGCKGEKKSAPIAIEKRGSLKLSQKDSSSDVKKEPEGERPLQLSDSTIYIYLSFDDGPNNGTPNLLKILEEFKVESSLFIVGKHVYGSKFQQKIFNSYPKYSFLELCNHSWSHANDNYKSYYANPDGVVADFTVCRDSLKFSNNISRAPGKNMWSISGDDTKFRTKTAPAEKLRDAGFDMIGWDVDWDFNTIKDHKQFMQRLIEIENSRYPKQYPAYKLGHIVVLLHDQSFCNAAKCEEFRTFLKIAQSMPNKYVFKKISEYPLLNQKVK
jgi:hypothetical protein